MRGRRTWWTSVAFVLLSITTSAAQLPLLDTLSRDPTDDNAYSELPWASVANYPSPCLTNYVVRGVVEASDQFDCAHVVDWPAGSPSDGWCIKFDAGTGGTRWEACGGAGSPLLVFGPDYVFFDDGGTDKLIYYTGS